MLEKCSNSYFWPVFSCIQIHQCGPEITPNFDTLHAMYAEDILCKTPQFFRNFFVFFAMNLGPPKLYSSLSTPNVSSIISSYLVHFLISSSKTKNKKPSLRKFLYFLIFWKTETPKKILP